MRGYGEGVIREGVDVVGEEAEKVMLSRLPLECRGDGNMEHAVFEYGEARTVVETVLEDDGGAEDARGGPDGGQTHEVVAKPPQMSNGDTPFK